MAKHKHSLGDFFKVKIQASLNPTGWPGQPTTLHSKISGPKLRPWMDHWDITEGSRKGGRQSGIDSCPEDCGNRHKDNLISLKPG